MVLELPEAPGLLGAAVLARWPWRLVRKRPAGVERPLWQTLAGLYAVVASLVLLVITLAFVVAHVVTGSAY